MINTQEIADRIKEESKLKDTSLKTLLENCELGKNFVNKVAGGTDVGYQCFIRIADYLGCSVDHLLCRDKKSPPVYATESELMEILMQNTPEELLEIQGFAKALALKRQALPQPINE